MKFFPILMIIVVVVILDGINALYIAGEFETASTRRPRMTQMADNSNRLAKILSR